MIEKAIKKALRDFFKSDEGQFLLTTAIEKALLREIEFEDGKSEPGKIIHKKEWWNILDWLARYLPYVEASIRGCQADSASARNRACETRDLLFRISELKQIEENEKRLLE